jgi:hypothetical protein
MQDVQLSAQMDIAIIPCSLLIALGLGSGWHE